MSNAAIKKITMKILEILEGPSDTGSVTCDPVRVTLKKGALAYPGAPFYLGLMRWKDETTGKKRKVDIVQAVFSKEGTTGDLGRVDLKVHLKGGLKFNQATPVSIVPVTNPTPEQQDLRFIEIVSVVGSDLTLSFLEPAEGQVVTYPVVYFLTKDANGDDVIIDPGLGAMRIPP
ncbi:MAG: hypothetical protein ACJAYF_000952 [Arenicella sp.]|jgi:hypothetical protein